MVDYVLEGPKWGTAGLGTAGGVVTWAIDATISATLAASIASAFADWASYANIQFQQVASIATSAIDFTLGAIDGLDNILGETSYYYSGSRFVSAAIEFDSGEGWHVAAGQIVSNDSVNFYVVALHEIGHALGLGHYNAVPTVMNAYVNLSVTDLRQSDIDGIRALYGQTDTSNLFGTTVHDTHGNGGEIFALYDAILNRQPDVLGFENAAAAMAHGVSLHDVAASFLGSPEAQAHMSAVDNATFVEQVYETTLHRNAEPTGLLGWTNQLNTGTSRADVVISIALSAENVSGMQASLNAGVFVPDQDAANVARLYYGLLGRAPDPTGLAAWTAEVHQGFSFSTIAQSFISSAEYQNAHAGQSDAQFVDSLYLGALGRHAESGGLQAATTALAHGAAPATIVLNIAESTEAQNHLLPLIEQGWHLA